MSSTPVKIDDHLHAKMKELAGNERGAITREYREAIENHIKLRTQQNIARDSGLEAYINGRVTRAENHISSMLGRTGMDTSITLMGVILLLEKLLKVDRVVLQNELRKQGARYYSTAIKEDKEKKKE